jgi:hypothetical protein
MINKSKLTLIAALVAMSAASPALAQSYSKGYGTGNVLPYTNEPGNTASTAASQNGQIAARPSNADKVAVRQNGHARFAGTGTQHRVQ